MKTLKQQTQTLIYRTIFGTNAGAAIYSVLETAKVNGLDTYGYMKYIIKQLPF